MDSIDLIYTGLLLILTGAVAGTLAGLLGVGGGIVIVPVLFNLFGLLDLPASTAMHMAVGTSLATIVPTSLSSLRAHHKKGAVDIPLLKKWGLGIFAGSVLGAFIAGQVKGDVLTAVFAVVALLVSLNMVRSEALTLSPALPAGTWLNTLISMIIGSFSAIMGIGGGTLSVPVLSSFSFPIHKAVGTASALGLLIAIPGVTGFILIGAGVAERPPLSLGYVSLVGFCLIFPTTVLFAPLGARIAHRLNRLWLRRTFALFLGLTSLRMFYNLLY
ncbi:sulfite exporter TauE/SafE family protein [Kiloniella laminariae]|uniref:Probable membrane transporter protein n=1 Tax=Kiloniella laminariae TaxID=454162 RepID=A0ABT4LI25_9PROT|nr:sulfite exporter TauE/SafE family protein [Kiloniella laminariae]MCZ4280742.1 sulfite exporter TauE/SafE family protein [Kiloniella laminariae]